jgi:hypothetical protein
MTFDRPRRLIPDPVIRRRFSMRKRLLPLAAFALVCLFSATTSAAANFVYHEQTAFVATPTCPSAGTDAACGRYVENTDRSGSAGIQIYTPETYSLHYKVEFHLLTNQARVYYTTDGSTPTGSRGTPDGTTQVATASYTCTYSDQAHNCLTVDVVSASIPPQPAGTTVKYIVSAWHSGGGDEIFANSGSCLGCFSCADSTTGCATVFQYNVIALPPTPLIISEFRLRGPGGANDEFVEIYNNGEAAVTVNAFDGSAGFALAASDGVARFTIPNGTVIPGRGHYLGSNSTGYTLGGYPAASTPRAGDRVSFDGAPTFESVLAPSAKPRLRSKAAGATVQRGASAAGGAAEGDEIPGPSAATGDAPYTIGIADNVGIALFATANPANFSLDTRLDAVGSTSEANPIYKEGAGYPAVVPADAEYSFYRDMCGKRGSITALGGCPNDGFPSDTGNNSNDFVYVSTGGTDIGAGERLGAPGPENSTSPVQRNDKLSGSLIFPCVPSSAPPNRVRDFKTGSPQTSTFGTLSVRRRITNNTGANVTRLRFRVIDISTLRAPAGTADLRAITSMPTVITNPCTLLPATIQGTTLEQPPTQSNGGGFNSSLSADTITLATPLLPGGTYDFQFLLGIQQTGSYKFYVNIEALP